MSEQKQGQIGVRFFCPIGDGFHIFYEVLLAVFAEIAEQFGRSNAFPVPDVVVQKHSKAIRTKIFGKRQIARSVLRHTVRNLHDGFDRFVLRAQAFCVNVPYPRARGKGVGLGGNFHN